MTPRSIDAVGDLAERVAVQFTGTELGKVAGAVAAARHEPLRLAVAGRVKAGKSTLLNALVGEALAPTDAGECTQVITWYHFGRTRAASAELSDGSTRSLNLVRTPHAVEVDLGSASAGIRKLDITWPASRLEAVTLVDTPGIGSLRHGVSGLAADMVADEDPARAVDAVIYLTNHVHPEDWRFLEAFTDDAGIRPDPSCAVAVISRADEVAGGGPDAIDQAALAALKAAESPLVRRSCQSVLPVSALLAAGAVRLTGEQHRLLVAMSADADVAARLRTATRFVDPAHDLGGIGMEARRALLAQLGLFGLRATVTLLHERPATNASELVASLRAMSGLDDLVAVIEHQFLRRRDALRSRTAVRALTSAASRHGSEAFQVLGELEAIEAADHELTELRLLADWRAGRLRLRPEEGADLERWLDPPSIPASFGRNELLATIERWRGLAEHPLTRPVESAAAQVVARSIERLLA